MNTSKSLDDILPCNCGMNDILNGKHYDDCPKALKPAIVEAVEGLIQNTTPTLENHNGKVFVAADELLEAIKEWQ